MALPLLDKFSSIPFTRQHYSYSSLTRRKPCTQQVLCCSGKAGESNHPGIGAYVGVRRFEEKALPGTYWNQNSEPNLGGDVLVTFEKGSEKIEAAARSGENLLRVAERCGMMVPDPNFCFQGSCFDCEMKVENGAQEAGSPSVSKIVRSCLCPIPHGSKTVNVELFDDSF